MKRIAFFLVALSLSQTLQGQTFKIAQEIRRLEVPGFVLGPVYSPDGKHIAFSGPKYDGISILDLQSGRVEEVCSDLGAGWGLRWIDECRLLVRATRDAADPRDRAMGVELIHIGSRSETPVVPFEKSNRIEVLQNNVDGRIVIQNRNETALFDLKSVKAKNLQKGDNPGFFKESTITFGNRTFKAPEDRTILAMVWSPNGERALVELMGRPSLHLFSRTSGTFQIAAANGERPCWINDDLYVYQETTDDGHSVLSGDIYVASVGSRERENLTASFGLIAQHPTATQDGGIIFSSEGKLFRMKLELPPPR
ncbi:MAG: hypothetical protein HYZ01_00500 [Ignavibacteriales bacterium]|nr:hypothetical protein [Ignavibacteriales bacterium]